MGALRTARDPVRPARLVINRCSPP